MSDDPSPIDPERLRALIRRAQNHLADTRHLRNEENTGPRPANEYTYRELLALWTRLPEIERRRTHVSIHVDGQTIFITSPESLVERDIGRVAVVGTLPDGTAYDSIEKAALLRCRVWVDETGTAADA